MTAPFRLPGTCGFEDDHAAYLASQDLFIELDRDSNGYLSRGEMRNAQEVMLRSTPVPDLSDDLPQMLCSIDGNGDGLVDKREWEDFCSSVYEVVGRSCFLSITKKWKENLQVLPSRGPRPLERLTARRSTRDQPRSVPTDGLPHLRSRPGRGASSESADDGSTPQLVAARCRPGRRTAQDPVGDGSNPLLVVSPRRLAGPGCADEGCDGLGLPMVAARMLPSRVEGDRGGRHPVPLQVGGAVGSGAKAKFGSGADPVPPKAAQHSPWRKPPQPSLSGAGASTGHPLHAFHGASRQGLVPSVSTPRGNQASAEGLAAQRRLLAPDRAQLLGRLGEDSQDARHESGDGGGLRCPSRRKDRKASGRSVEKPLAVAAEAEADEHVAHAVAEALETCPNSAPSSPKSDIEASAERVASAVYRTSGQAKPGDSLQRDLLDCSDSVVAHDRASASQAAEGFGRSKHRATSSQARPAASAIAPPAVPRSVPAAPRRVISGIHGASREAAKQSSDDEERDERERAMAAAAARIQALQRGKMARRRYGTRPALKPAANRDSGDDSLADVPTGPPSAELTPEASAASTDVDGEKDRAMMAAATRIQAAQRGKMARRQHKVKADGRLAASKDGNENSQGVAADPSAEARPSTEGHFKEDARMHQAAARIQALQRGKLARKEFEIEKRTTLKAASKIQAQVRGRTSRRESANLVQSASLARAAAGDAEAAVRAEEPRTTLDEAWELMTMQFGFVTNQLRVVDFVETYRRCKETGLNQKIVEFVPQDLPEDIADAEAPLPDLSAAEFAHLCTTLVDCPDMSDEDVIASLWTVQGEIAQDDRQELILDADEVLGFALFKRLVGLITFYTHLDEEHILAHLLWAKTGCFEFTKRMACVLMERCFLRRAAPNGSILDQVVQNCDFLKVCSVGGVVGTKAGSGLPYSTLSLTFAGTVRKMPELLDARAKVRAGIRGHKITSRKSIPQAFSVPVAVRGLAGRTELSVLMDEVFKVTLSGMYRSPLHMVLSIFESTPAPCVARGSGD